MAGPDVNPRELAEDQEALRKSLIKNVGVEGVEFKDIVCLSHFTMNIRMVDKFGEGRGFVTGDAGHVHSPTGGQGMNSGIQDSFNLGWKLALVAKGIAPRSLLDTYTEERIPVIAEMLNETTKILTKATNSNFGEDTWGRDGTLLQLGVNYRWSSIVVDEQGAEGAEDGTHITAYGNLDGKLKAGDRAPDAPGLVQHKPASRATIRLFDLFNPAHHTVLLFSTSGGNEHAEVVQSLARYPEGTIQFVIVTRMGSTQSGMEGEGVDFVVEDGAGSASAAYGAAVAQGCSIAIIRPDGVVGAFVTGTQGVHRYFKGILLERAAFAAA
ncbi:FAD binding domain-containing protein [Infundibulicybe gibba]|nr:FAD binding domain-containing protein [Infundibulicybe gibba]